MALLAPIALALSLDAPPDFLRATDGGFTLDSVQRRLPLIIDSIVDSNKHYPQSAKRDLQTLKQQIQDNQPLRPLNNPTREWEEELKPHLERGCTWFSAPWFLVENYFYKRILEITDPLTNRADPFAPQKSDSLESSANAFADILESGVCDSPVNLPAVVTTSLWGNVADLSLSGGAKLAGLESSFTGATKSRMLVDDSPELCHALAAAKEVIIVLDNCGLELVADLVLTDALSRLPVPPKVHLHVKDRPVFVSDVVKEDITPTLAWLEENGGGSLAARLKSALADSRVEVFSHEFYNSGREFWNMPDDLRECHSEACVVLLKGDANYRRLLGDRHWPHDTPFESLMRLYWPPGVDVAALRTCKSGVLIGVNPEVEAAAASSEPDRWLTAGIYGMISFAGSMPSK